MSLKPWREIVSPHRDVLGGAFRQSEFATDITAVCNGEATREYQDAAAFFDRTVITEGVRWLLTHVVLRLTDQEEDAQNGEPVIPLQSPPGGGKTHSLLAVYHLVTRQCLLAEMIGIPELLESIGYSDIPYAQVVVLDGTAHSPGQHWKHGQRIVRTLWGELAWQLGGEAAFERVLDADATGTAPTKAILQEFLETYAPCVILIDDIAAYMQQLPEGQTLSGGSYESNLSFVQSLMEVARLVPTTMVLASLPQSSDEVRGPREITAFLHAMDKVFHYVKSAWKPPTIEETFEIVRCRLFDPIRDPVAQDAVCRAFAKIYEDEATRLPGEIQKGHYLDRLNRIYPIHPELFDRLYEDWTTLKGFPHIRGVLKCLAQFIFRLWRNNSRDLLILPSSVPLYDGCSRVSLTCYLPPGWDVVIDRDIDGDHAITAELETHDLRFSAVNAAHRVARTLFLGSAPASVTPSALRGLDRAHVLLGCLQPGQSSLVYIEALGQLAERMRYLKHAGSTPQEASHFWFEPPAEIHASPRRALETAPIVSVAVVSAATPKASAVQVTAEIPAATMVQLAAALAADPQATVTVTLEISVAPPQRH